MRILFVNQTAQMSGAEQSLLGLIDGLRGRADVAVACPPGDFSAALAERGVRVHRIVGTDASFRLHPLHTSRALGEIAAGGVGVACLVRRLRPDIVHANTTRAGLIACAGGLTGGPPIVVHVRDWVPEGRASQLTLGWARRRASAVIAISRFVADQFPQRLGGAPIAVVPNPIDTERFDPVRVPRAAARAALGLADDEVVLGVVGQLTPWKGQDDAIRTLALLRRRPGAPKTRLLVVGSAKFAARSTRFDNMAYADALARLPAELGVADAVTFLGERRDVPQVIGALDLLLLPSWREAFGRVGPEAMAMQVPVAATDVGGPAEIVRHGVDGLSLPPRSPERWAAAIGELLDNPYELLAMGRRARTSAVERFGVARCTDGVMAVYDGVLAGRG